MHINEIVFKIAFLVLWVIYILIRAPFTSPYKQAEKIKVITPSTEKALLVVLSIGLLFIPMCWSLTPWLDRFSMSLPIWLRILGIVIAILSLFYFYWIHKALGASWSPKLEIMKGQKLVTSGPYRSIRHPMYAQGWLWTIAQVLIVSNSIAGLSGVIAWALLYFIRVPREEQMMIDTFGDEYRNYMKQTGRVLPKL